MRFGPRSRDGRAEPDRPSTSSRAKRHDWHGAERGYLRRSPGRREHESGARFMTRRLM